MGEKVARICLDGGRVGASGTKWVKDASASLFWAKNPYSDLFKLPSSLSGDTEAGRPLWEKQGAQWLALGLVAIFRSSRPVHGRLTAN